MFVLNLDQFARNKYNLDDLLMINFSMMLLFFSLYLLILSLQGSYTFYIKLEYPSRSESHRGKIKLGRILYKNKKKYYYYLNLDDLTQHVFVCGITGSGKSNFVQHFLLEFTRHYNIPFLLTEFKGEYLFLQEKINDLLILRPGENFSINIFDPEGTNPRIHAERIFQIFQSGGMFEDIEYSPQMERMFIQILYKTCIKEENRNWNQFQLICKNVLVNSSDPSLQKSIMAIENRIRRYTLGSLKKIFGTKSKLSMRQLFSQNVLIDLSSIIRLGGEKQDALFFLNMILKYLWDKNVTTGSEDYTGIKHLTIIEDAQYFAPDKGTEKIRLTTYLEDIALLLRGTGECLISLATRPNISKEILANCGILACFQTHFQKDLMVELLNLEE
ncbi:MAG: ATP-binding protein, partial [Promethearchaeota archaeon]